MSLPDISLYDTSRRLGDFNTISSCCASNDASLIEVNVIVKYLLRVLLLSLSLLAGGLLREKNEIIACKL